MTKVVLDANQYVSAILSPLGSPAKIFQLMIDRKISVFVSLDILAEIERVLNYPRLVKLHRYTPQEIDLIVKGISDIAKMTPGRIKLDVVENDPTDNKYLECAVESGAAYIISGDKHLIEIKHFQNIKISTPNEFLNEVFPAPCV